MRLLRFWTAASGKGSSRQARLSRINERDAHLSFDERIAERMRELEREKHSAGAQPVATPPQGFGRRQA